MQKLTAQQPCLLKDFLSQSLKISGTKAKQLLDGRKVFVNNQRVWIASYKLKAGDIVEIIVSQRFASALPSPYQGEGGCRVSGNRVGYKESQSKKTLIVTEDNDYLIVNKPAGSIVNENKNSLENRLRKDLQNPHLQAAHRLDKDTSGLVIFAKSPEAFGAIVKVFRELGIEKTYRCLVQGNILKKFPAEFTLKQPLAGQSAETKIRILKANPLAGYLEVRLVTGRKHQIRLHLSQAGFPVLGEQTYQTKALDNPLYRQIPRQMLHAANLKFTNPLNGKLIQASAPEPADFRNALKLLQL